jgi:hypothetical protein
MFGKTCQGKAWREMHVRVMHVRLRHEIIIQVRVFIVIV